MGRAVRAGVGVGLGSLAVPVGIGWLYAGVLLDTTIRTLYPERVLAADADTVTLAPGGLARQPGTWGLRWPTGFALEGLIVCEKGLRENRKRTSPLRKARTI